MKNVILTPTAEDLALRLTSPLKTHDPLLLHITGEDLRRSNSLKSYYTSLEKIRSRSSYPFWVCAESVPS